MENWNHLKTKHQVSQVLPWNHCGGSREETLFYTYIYKHIYKKNEAKNF